MNFILTATIAFGCLISLAQSNIHLPCTTTDDCIRFIQNSICNESAQECECPTDTILSSDLEICLPIPEDDALSCQDNTQCSAVLSIGGICSEGTCKCGEGFHYLKGVCWRSVGLGETCDVTEECFADYEYIGFQCDQNVCKCKDNFYERLGSGCRRIMREGESCFINDDCRCGDDLGTIGKCISNVCTCQNSLNEPFDLMFNNEVEVEVEIEGEGEGVTKERACPPGSFTTKDGCKFENGMDCKAKDECGAGRSDCYDNICECVQIKDGKFSGIYISTPDNRRCVLPASPDTKSCSDDVQCATFGKSSKCVENVCTCTESSHFVEEDAFCYDNKKLGEDCTTDKDCYTLTGPSTCKDSTCQCQDGYHQRSDDCFKDAFHVGEDCSADVDCLFSNSKCESSKCACQEGYFASEGLCVQGISSECTNDAQCSNVGNATCNTTLGICTCLEGFVSSGDEKYCLPVTEYEGNCNETVQCIETLGELKECRNGLCICQESAHFSNGKCYETKELGEKCTNKNECTNGQDFDAVFCLNGRCACQFYYVKNSNNKCVKDYGSDDSDKDNAGNTQQLSVLLITTFSFLLLFNKNI